MLEQRHLISVTKTPLAINRIAVALIRSNSLVLAGRMGQRRSGRRACHDSAGPGANARSGTSFRKSSPCIWKAADLARVMRSRRRPRWAPSWAPMQPQALQRLRPSRCGSSTRARQRPWCRSAGICHLPRARHWTCRPGALCSPNRARHGREARADRDESWPVVSAPRASASRLCKESWRAGIRLLAPWAGAGNVRLPESMAHVDLASALNLK